MAGKSVVIIGKGPSVLKSTSKFVASFDEVAICNFPPIEGYEQYIGNRATYHFLNVHDPNPYSKDVLNSLGLKYMFNTHYKPHNGHPSIFPDHQVFYSKEYGQKRVFEFQNEYGFDPSTGIQAYDYFARRDEFDTIALVGFDFWSRNQRVYYFPVEETQQSHLYLYGPDKPYSSDGRCVIEHPHNSTKSKEFIYNLAEKHKIKLNFIEEEQQNYD